MREMTVEEILARQNSILRDEILVLRDALELVRGFLINQGYSEDDPLVLGLINEALNWEEDND